LSSAERVSKPRRARSVTESLLSIVLAIEAIVLFFAALTAFGLHVVPGWPAWAYLVAGLVAVMVFVLDVALLRWPIGVGIGWVLQAALIGLGILLPLMYVIGAGLALFWIWCFTRGRRLDAARSQGENS
jgi:uncharacterized protein DUF4233